MPYRAAVAEVHPLIAARWSPRALDPDATIDEAVLRSLFEAARWAPSRGNLQPARFVLGRRGDRAFELLRDVLRPRNRAWAGHASALALGIAVTADDAGRPFPHARYDLGQAAATLALQAVAHGLVTHPMAGFEPAAARAAFALPPTHEPVVVIAIGVLGDASALPDDLRERERRPRTRRPLSATVFGATYGDPAFGEPTAE